jgi:hypothetical protein
LPSIETFRIPSSKYSQTPVPQKALGQDHQNPEMIRDHWKNPPQASKHSHEKTEKSPKKLIVTRENVNKEEEKTGRMEEWKTTLCLGFLSALMLLSLSLSLCLFVLCEV